jgi:hypothetical protein
MKSWIRKLNHVSPPVRASEIDTIEVLDTAFVLIEKALREASAVRWLIGRPFVRLEQARAILRPLRSSLAFPDDRALERALDDYEGICRAIAGLQRSRALVQDEPVELTADIRRQVEGVRGSEQALRERLAGLRA